jgi:hypothetical protein
MSYINPNGVLSWDALLPYVLPYVRGAPPEMVLHHIRMATIELCNWSGIIHDVNQYDLQKGVQDYQLNTDCNYNIVRIKRVTVDGRWDYTPVTAKLPAGIGAYLYQMTSPTMIHLRRPPNLDNPKGLEVEAVVAPKQDAEVLDNYLYEQWAQGIAYGAISTLIAIPQTNWYNPKEAERYELKFRKEKARCRAEADRAFSTSSVAKTQPWVGPANRGWGGGAGYWPGGGR